MMTNTEIIQALGRWSHDPSWSERGAKALRRAALSLIMIDRPIAEEGRAGRLTRLRWVGPFVARLITELLDGSRAPEPDPARWPEGARRAYAAVPSYDTFLALYDARRIVAERTFPQARGDLQSHTTWSDGAASPKSMARAAANLGYEYLAITDHGVGLRIAHGLSPERLRQQRRTVARMRLQGIRLLLGVEANVSADGALDLTPDELSEAQIVVASCHSRLRRPEDQTERLLAAVCHPCVHVLGHPRGRLFGTVRSIQADWTAVFNAAAACGTAIEINASVDRQDVDYSLARRAVEAGCWISLATDSHAQDELATMDLARAHAAAAGVPPDRILNFLPLQALEEWLRRKRSASTLAQGLPLTFEEIGACRCPSI